MGISRFVAAVATGTVVAAATLFAGPAAHAAAGYATVVQWSGGKTKACRVDDAATGTSRIKVYWDGRGYHDPSPGAIQRGAGGLAHVSANFAISGWTYSFGKAGGTGPVVSRVESTQGYVYFLAGSAVGICKETIVRVTSVNPC